MINLMALKDDYYIAYCLDKDVYVLGSLELARETLNLLGVEDEEINQVLEEFVANGHNFATFGVNRRWTFTSYLLTGNGKKAVA